MRLTDTWYRSTLSWNILLWPLEWLFCHLATRRRARQIKRQWQAPCPVIIVGNISIGGTGKSPLTIALIESLQQQGYQVGVVSRGYGAKRKQFPYQVRATDNSTQSPDEPLMIVRRTGVNLVIDPNRVRACQYLLANNECDLIISDDGLQHYALGRDIEIVVIDGSRGLGNGHCLPVGPLREAPQRLQQVDFVMVNGERQLKYPHQTNMQIEAVSWHRVSDDQQIDLKDFSGIIQGAEVHAIAGIGNPQRFYSTLAALGIVALKHSFADHHQYTASDFEQISKTAGAIFCMTEKDAVKCKNIAPGNSYYLKIAATLDRTFIDKLVAAIRRIPKSINKREQ